MKYKQLTILKVDRDWIVSYYGDSGTDKVPFRSLAEMLAWLAKNLEADSS